jgi:hypothetical protein
VKLPIGYSDFKKIITNKFDYIDKTLLIKEILDDAEVVLITRPRRFGKTLNMSMLRYFFAAEVDGQSTQDLFAQLHIAQFADYCAQYQGKHPVVFLTFKDIKETNFVNAYASFGKCIKDVYAEHRYLLVSDVLYEEEKIVYESILKQEATLTNLSDSLKDLTKYLYRYYGKNPLVLIDEYDTPIQAGYLHDYYDEIVGLFRNFFSAALKDNASLFKAVLTGILRISRENLFSGLNHLKVYSVLHPKYGAYFGFTESEVGRLLEQTGLKDKASDIKYWYNGYQIGPHVLYNPWSIVNCIQEQGLLKPYWVNTSDNKLIKNLLVQSNLAFKDQIELLLREIPIDRFIDENFVFSDLTKYRESAIWNLLFMTGYLKVISYQETEQGSLCRLAIPNKEIHSLYRKIIEQWLANGQGIEWYNQLLEHLLCGDVNAFAQDLRQIMQQTFNAQDVAKEPETFYHGFMIGLTASLYSRNDYEIRSNRESGYGRYDYMIFSSDINKPTIVLEFKKVTIAKVKEKTAEGIEDVLNKKAQEALQQIEQQAYLAEAKQRGRKKILKIGLAFHSKRFGIAYKQ